MGFYIVFDNLSSLFDASQSADIAKDIETAVTNSVDTAGIDVSEVSQVTVSVESDGEILLKVDDSSEGSEGAVSAIDYDRGAAALLSQIPAACAPESEQTQLPKIEAKVYSRNDDNEEFHSAFEKLDISLRYRIDYTDIFRSRQEIENSESVGKLTEKNWRRSVLRKTKKPIDAFRKNKPRVSENI